MDAIDPRPFSLPPKQDEQPAIAEPPTLMGKLAQPSRQLGVRRLPGPVANHRPVRADDRTGPPFRKPHEGLQVRRSGALGGGPCHFLTAAPATLPHRASARPAAS